MKMCGSKRSAVVKGFNNKGFTFVEMIFAFSFFLMIVTFIPLGLRLILDGGFVEKELQRLEWEVFVSQVKKEIHTSEGLSVEYGKLRLKKDGQSIVYERWGTNLRRRVDLQGHEVILQKVKTVTFEPVVQGIKISIVDIFGQNYTVTIHMMVDGENFDVP